MSASDRTSANIHLVGSIAMENCEEVFTRISEEFGPYINRIPDGETGERSRWIFFQRSMLQEHPAMEVDPTVPELELYQWDGKFLRSLPLVRFKQDVDPDSVEFDTAYDKAAEYSYNVFKQLQKQGKIPANVRFQVSLPTPMATGFMYVSPKARDTYHRIYEKSLLKALDKILNIIPPHQLAIQFDVCLEVLVFEGYFSDRPVDYKQQIFAQLGRLGDAVLPEEVELGYHLCYGTPFEEHLVMPKDTTILVELMNGIAGACNRRVDFLHLPVPKDRKDREYFKPLLDYHRNETTKIMLGLIHHDDEQGDHDRIETAREFIDDFGIATECGWGRIDPSRVPSLLASHRKAAEAM